MRPEKNPLDLNNLPEDYTCSRGGLLAKQSLDECPSSGGCRKDKNGGNKEVKDESGKVYECRFCSLKFCKSQALGGHMNRHRQERETEALNHARQLVFNSENPAAAHGLPFGCHPMAPGNYNIGDPYRSMYPPTLFSGSSLPQPRPQPQPPPPPHHPPYLYTSPSHLHPPYTSQFSQQGLSDYYIGHVVNNTTTSLTYTSQQNIMSSNCNALDSNTTTYTCIGALVGGGGGAGVGGFGPLGSGHRWDQGSNGGDREGLEGNINENGMNWSNSSGRHFDQLP